MVTIKLFSMNVAFCFSSLSSRARSDPFKKHNVLVKYSVLRNRHSVASLLPAEYRRLAYILWRNGMPDPVVIVIRPSRLGACQPEKRPEIFKSNSVITNRSKLLTPYMESR